MIHNSISGYLSEKAMQDRMLCRISGGELFEVRGAELVKVAPGRPQYRPGHKANPDSTQLSIDVIPKANSRRKKIFVDSKKSIN